jgi:hypothetical protein
LAGIDQAQPKAATSVKTAILFMRDFLLASKISTSLHRLRSFAAF